MKTLKQVVGIDISKDSFHTCLGIIDEKQKIQLIRQTSFTNNDKGFDLLFQWVNNHSSDDLPVWFVLEATGVYYENLAYFLSRLNKNICVLLPNKSKHFAKSLDIKTKTDKVDAAMLCRIGLERALPVWNIPSPNLKQLKSLTREHRILKANSTKIKVRLHALRYSHHPEKQTIRRLNQQMKLMSKQIGEVEAEMRVLINKDGYLKERFANIEHVKGISTITIATIVAETNGFASIENAKQLASYAGLDVMMNQSGMYSGRTRISKKGNSHIRSALYLPAMSSMRCNTRLRQFYQNIMQRHTCGKIGIIAVARKLLILIYTLWKKNIKYDPELNVAEI